MMYTHKGYIYRPEKDIEEDNVKIFHFITRPDKSSGTVKMSPYETLSEVNFQHWVDMGCPKAERGNLFNSEIEELWEKFNG